MLLGTALNGQVYGKQDYCNEFHRKHITKDHPDYVEPSTEPSMTVTFYKIRVMVLSYKPSHLHPGLYWETRCRVEDGHVIVLYYVYAITNVIFNEEIAIAEMNRWEQKGYNPLLERREAFVSTNLDN